MFYYKQKTNYEAPKWMEGEYALKVHGRKITIERLSLADDDVSTKSHATCHKDDQFDIGEWVKVALNRLKEKKEEKLKVGDKVEIVNAGDSYQSLGDVSPKFATRYRYGCVPYSGDRGMIVGWHNQNKGIAYVKIHDGKYFGNPDYTDIPCNDGVYAVGIRGLKKV